MLNIENEEHNYEEYDLVIIGGGPAGSTAALYASRSKLKTLVIEKENLGSLISAHKIDNYTGFVDGISGKDLYQKMKDHAKRFGAKYTYANFLELDMFQKPRIVKTDVKNYLAKTVIFATGWTKNNAKKLKGEEEFLGKGVSYCATCDGAFFKKMTVAVVGQGEEAVEEALFLTQHAKEVLFFATNKEEECSKEAKEIFAKNEKIKVQYEKELLEIKGNDYVENILIKDLKTGLEEEYKSDAAFLYLGTKSNSEVFSMFANVDEKGYIISNEKMETNVEGIYVAGDLRQKIVRQISTAVADGTIAGLEAIKYVMKNKK